MSLINDEEKYKTFLKKTENQNEFLKEINDIYNTLFKDFFKNILNIPKIDFLSKLTKEVNLILFERYSNKITDNDNFEKISLSCSDKYDKKYDECYTDLSTQWKKYLHQKSRCNKNENDEKKLDIFYFKNFIKHCSKTGEYALHYCKNANKACKFICVYKIERGKKNILELKYLICENCRKVYFIKAFKNYCEYCKVKYYSSILNNENLENENLFLATVYPTHCNLLFNKIILCQKCNKHLYINIKTNQLVCLNKNCKYVELNPDNLEWKCNKCESNYMTRAIIYNEIEIIHYEDMIEKALILKKLAHPNKTCCINTENISSVVFYHNKKCKGNLYFFKEKETLFIVCEKCRAINYFKNFIWTCPFCGLYYREINSDEKNGKLFQKQKNQYRNKKRNLFEYIKKAKYCTVDNYDDKNLESILNDNKSLITNVHSNKFNNNLINYKTIAYSVASSNTNTNNMKLKNISPELSTSLVETNNELTNQRAVSQSKRSGLCRRILKGFIKLEDKGCNSVEKRNIFINKETKDNTPSFDNIENSINNNKINKHFYSKFKLKINLKKNYNNYLSAGRQIYNGMENSDNIDHLDHENLTNDIYVSNSNNNLYSVNKTQNIPYVINLKNYVDNNFYKRENIMNLKAYNSGILLDKKKDEKEKNIINNKNKILYRKNILPKNNNVLNKTKDNITSNSIEKSKNICCNNIEKNKKEIINHSVSKRLDLTNNKSYKRDNTINENPPIKKEHNNIINICNINTESIIPSINKMKYSVSITDENDRTRERRNINKYEKEDNGGSVNKIEKKKDESKKINKSKDREKEIGNVNKNNNNKRQKDSDSNNKDNKEMPKKIKKMWRIKQFFVNKDINYDNNNTTNYVNNINNYNNINNNIVIKEIKMIKTDDNKKEGKKRNEKEQKKNRNNNREKINKISIIDKEDTEETTLSTGIKIDNEKLKNNKKLYENIKMRLVSLVSRSKLPLFNVDNYLIWQKIGNGSTGEIYEMSNNKTNKRYAVKIIKENNITSLEYTLREFELIYQNKHKNIINIYGICIRCSNKNSYILYVLMDLALYDWEDEISRRKKDLLFYTEKELIIILKQLIAPLLFLQNDKNISHRDIKLENILIFENNIFKLCDFGEAKQKAENNDRKTLRGTDFYMSPLLYEGLMHNVNYVQHNPYKSDVFSLGLSMIIAATLNSNIIEEIRKIKQEEDIRELLTVNFNGRYSNFFIYLMAKMIEIEEKNRPDFIELNKIVKNHYSNI